MKIRRSKDNLTTEKDDCDKKIILWRGKSLGFKTAISAHLC